MLRRSRLSVGEHYRGNSQDLVGVLKSPLLGEYGKIQVWIEKIDMPNRGRSLHLLEKMVGWLLAW